MKVNGHDNDDDITNSEIFIRHRAREISHMYIYYMYSHYKPIERSIHNKGNGSSEMILKALNSGLCFFFILPCCVSLLANIY